MRLTLLACFLLFVGIFGFCCQGHLEHFLIGIPLIILGIVVGIRTDSKKKAAALEAANTPTPRRREHR